MSKHTPGPWDVDEGDFGIYQLETSDQIAEVFSHHPPAELEANARLIAAAPELLGALHSVMAEWRDGYGLNCLEQVRAAIAKAEGHGL